MVAVRYQYHLLRLWKTVQDYVQIFAQQSTFSSLLLLDNFAINHQNLTQQNGNGLP